MSDSTSTIFVQWVTDFESENLYWDKGSGAAMDGSFWRAIPPKGWYNFGDYCQDNYSFPYGYVATVRNQDWELSPGGPLAKPAFFDCIWTDRGSGADENGSIWLPIAPHGYVTLGGVAQRGYETPDRPDIVCLRKDFVSRVDFGSLIWCDKGSGADQDVTVYSLGDLGTFLPVNDYDTHGDKVYALEGSMILFPGLIDRSSRREIRITRDSDSLSFERVDTPNINQSAQGFQPRGEAI